MNPYGYYPGYIPQRQFEYAPEEYNYVPQQNAYYSQDPINSEYQQYEQEDIDRQTPLERRVRQLERQNEQQVQEINRLSQEITRLNREILRINQEIIRLNQNDQLHTRRLNRLNQRLRAVETRLNIPFAASEDGF
ncbi:MULTISPECIES: hypothetical protein [Bacillaceae]|nr:MULTISPECIES: hypothetical protein [Bacillaceae]